MEIIDPKDIVLSRSLLKTLTFISNGIDELNSKDLSVEQRQKILDSLMVPHIRSSLGIEEIRASARQTKEVLDFYRINDEVMDGKGNQEIVNLQNANEFITSEESKSAVLSVNFIKQVHYLVTAETAIRGSGEFKDRPNEFKDGIKTPMPVMVPQLIEDVSEYFELTDQRDPIVMACWLHNQIAKIHPFNDGNGRTARTLQDWVLSKNNYLPCSTGSLNRLTYYDILEEADDGNWENLVEHIAQAQSDSLAIAMQSIKSSERGKRRLQNVFGLFAAKKVESDDQEYTAWRYQAKQLVGAFEQACDDLNQGLKEAGQGENYATFIEQPLITKESWNLIKEDGLHPRNQAFVIYFCINKEAFYRSIGYFARHFIRDEDTNIVEDKMLLKNEVSLYLGGHDEPPEVDHPAKGMKLKGGKTGDFFAELPFKDERIALREVLIYKNNIYKYRYLTRWLRQEFIDKGHNFILDGQHEMWLPETSDATDVATEYVSNMYEHKTGYKKPGQN
ncbi:Fic family protein [Gammaproteobacteria bacterium]|nr:Fic family protein [Gammaproteobacteria bacterium]